MKTTELTVSMTAKTIFVCSLLLTLNAVSPAADTNAPTEPKPIGRHIERDTSKPDLTETNSLNPKDLAASRRERARERREAMDARTQARADARRMEAI